MASRGCVTKPSRYFHPELRWESQNSSMHLCFQDSINLPNLLGNYAVYRFVYVSGNRISCCWNAGTEDAGNLVNGGGGDEFISMLVSFWSLLTPCS